MIRGYENGESLDLYAQLLENGIKPDQVTFTGLISVWDIGCHVFRFV